MLVPVQVGAKKIVQTLHQLGLVAFQEANASFGEIVELVYEPMDEVEGVVFVWERLRFIRRHLNLLLFDHSHFLRYLVAYWSNHSVVAIA